jgi:hypothetical protein
MCVSTRIEDRHGCIDPHQLQYDMPKHGRPFWRVVESNVLLFKEGARLLSTCMYWSAIEMLAVDFDLITFVLQRVIGVHI